MKLSLVGIFKSFIQKATVITKKSFKALQEIKKYLHQKYIYLLNKQRVLLDLYKKIKKSQKPKARLSDHESTQHYFRPVHATYMMISDVVRTYLNEVQIVIDELVGYNVLKKAEKKHIQKEILKSGATELLTQEPININEIDGKIVRLNLKKLEEISSYIEKKSPYIVNYVKDISLSK